MLMVVLAGQPVFWTTIEHGGYLLGLKGRGRMSKHGVKAGTPDIYILSQGKTVFLELKTPKGALSREQRMTHNWIMQAGGFVRVCRSVEDVARVLDEHRIPHLDFEMSGVKYGKEDTTPADGVTAQSPQSTPP